MPVNKYRYRRYLRLINLLYFSSWCDGHQGEEPTLPAFCWRRFLGLFYQGTSPIKAEQGLERAMFAPLKYLVAFPAVFLIFYGTMPVIVSSMYGGYPPPHIAGLLNKQMDTFSAVARMIFGPIAPNAPSAKE
jgi:hypothetical protein